MNAAHDLIHEHEEAGEKAAIAAGLLGLLALGGLLRFRRRSVPHGFLLVALGGALGVGGWVGYTANLGGQIRHPEIRGAAGEVGTTEREEEDHDEGDDDHSEHEHEPGRSPGRVDR